MKHDEFRPSDAIVQEINGTRTAVQWYRAVTLRRCLVMPSPNNYDVGEGLNTGGIRWVRSAKGSENRFGFGFTDVRKQLNLKIDHNFNARNKLSGNWTYERVHSDYAGGPWPFRFDGVARRLLKCSH